MYTLLCVRDSYYTYLQKLYHPFTSVNIMYTCKSGEDPNKPAELFFAKLVHDRAYLILSSLVSSKPLANDSCRFNPNQKMLCMSFSTLATFSIATLHYSRIWVPGARLIAAHISFSGHIEPSVKIVIREYHFLNLPAYLLLTVWLFLNRARTYFWHPESRSSMRDEFYLFSLPFPPFLVILVWP